jgi:hypothetical protein
MPAAVIDLPDGIFNESLRSVVEILRFVPPTSITRMRFRDMFRASTMLLTG